MMPAHRTLLCAAALTSLASPFAGAQTTQLPLDAAHWTATDTLKFEMHLGRPSVYINTGVALFGDLSVDDGTIELDMASAPRSSNLGVAFHAASLKQMEVVYFQAGAIENPNAIQYAPAFNGVATAWQLYHYAGATGPATFPREQWVHVKLQLSGGTARVFLNDDTLPRLVVPRLAGTDGHRVGVWASNFGRGAWFSNIRVTPVPLTPVAAAPRPAAGTITDWQLSQTFDAADITPGRLPDMSKLSWTAAGVQPEGFVHIDRWRAGPGIIPPSNPQTHEPLVDSIVRGRVKGSRVVFARTTIRAAQAHTARIEFMFSDEVTVYLNGRPLYTEINPSGFRGDELGVMDKRGKVLYLPLRPGANDLVFAVTEFFGGWAVGARLLDDRIEPSR